MMKDAYCQYYTPLVQQFCQAMKNHDPEELRHLPQPFLPLFGKNYENSACRILFIGQDTKGWWNTQDFINTELATPGKAISDIFSFVDNFHFRHLPRNTHAFLGFAMAMLASVYGIQNWNVLKSHGHEDVLGTFAWANANAIEQWQSLTKHTSGVSNNTWQAAQDASTHFNRLEHVLTTLKPRVVVLTAKSRIPDSYFLGLVCEDVESNNPNVNRYHIRSHNVDIFHTCHPGYMRRKGGPWHFLKQIHESLASEGIAPIYPEFVTDDKKANATIKQLLSQCPKPDGRYERKFEFILWIANELQKHGSIMCVPQLADLANQAGYRTNWGKTFSGGRGSYRLIKTAYDHVADRHGPEAAQTIALAFMKPNLTYAY